MLFTLSIVAFVCLLLLSLWAFRHKLIDYLPDHVAARFKDYVPVGTFEAAVQGGFNSSTFDLSGNLEGDQRQGLDEESLTEIRRIMDIQRVNFDEARFIRSQRIMRKNGIDPNTGLPLDKKAITHL
ncbi:hypothetical protein P389DRAFT_86144 [Cystobasidium minutum MCA 4210]|uniref:uncharacterized protein n=1 Tax=Cystobasidium minutum MCA 4210 TaxID=1397322 RepID=UPI0034CE0F73|eukprot:jgi/Rhomi1/86144/CE86143_1079